MRLLLVLLLLLPTARLPAAGIDEKGAVQADPLRFGILAVAPPSRVVALWTPFTRYLSRRLGRPIQIVSTRGMDLLEQRIRAGEVDVFYINSYIYYRLGQAGLARAIAQMENAHGSIFSQSYFFVRQDSPIHTAKDIEGKRVAYISPVAAGAYLAPRARLRENRIEEGEAVFTRNFRSTLREVMIDPNTVGALCRVRYGMLEPDDLKAANLRVVDKSEPYPEHVIAVRADLPEDLARRLADIIIRMHDDPEGREVLLGLQRIRIGRFVPYDPSVEEVTARLIQKAGLREAPP